MIKWGQIDRATNIVSKIYAHATEEQVALKVQVLQAAVRQSIEIARTTAPNAAHTAAGSFVRAYHGACGSASLR